MGMPMIKAGDFLGGYVLMGNLGQFITCLVPNSALDCLFKRLQSKIASL